MAAISKRPRVAKVFRDPVHNLISLEPEDSELLLSLIDAPEFQRLRRIRQLGLSAFTFHGAEHTRFTHSLGAYHVAKSMLLGLEGRKAQFGTELFQPLEKRRREILAAALLHDLGHGPFSHVFERAVVPGNATADYPKDHEGWTVSIIRDRIANSSSHKGVDWEFVCQLYSKGGPDQGAARDIISSQLDADRLDYLLRDSHAAGVPYGRFDLHWLLHSIRVGLVRRPGVADKMPRLCFTTPKARAVVEQYVQARQCMYLQVYTHKTTRAYEALLRNIFELAGYIQENGGPLPDATPDALRKALARDTLTSDQYLELDDFLLWHTLREWARASTGRSKGLRLLSEKADALVNRRKPYRTIELPDREQQDAALEVVTILKSRGNLQQFSCSRDRFEDPPYRDIFYARGKEEEEEQVRPIYLLDDDGNTRLAEEASDVIEQLSKVPMQFCRFHYDESAARVVELLKGNKFLREAVK